MNIYLTGYRGIGKSTAARLVAERLGWTFADVDDEIERRAGKTIAEIFAQDGEGPFRDLEASVLEDFARRDRLVVALGGGTILRESNRRAIARSGKAVWLQASPETHWKRITADSASAARRPNLTSRGGIEEVQELIEKRSPYYQEVSSLTLDANYATPHELAEQIVQWLESTRST